ncbi:hypothetical protein [Stenotrophomonas sp. SORGH_AS_0321]|uniref:hypothetical protein n=1 Tax=Stenotrophomonas sp. SORGH_AS_0321 TaxID=3041787 RepID=UPI002859CD01|nr:hypothetical protein [Stenotrophomonas sp. SORGH_AS_0321]MDR6095078.1 hypothetical protein [Stenotrophomonas sp. SORGH_AS_0321]
MELTEKQQRILEAIQATRPVAEEDAAWAVQAGLAAHGEDGDIDLTQEGRRYVDSSSL